MRRVDYKNLKCRDCGVPLPRPRYNLTVKQAARRMCRKCRVALNTRIGRTVADRNASIPVTESAKQVALGTILGDGHLESPSLPNGEWGLAIKHSVKQEDYLRWKAGILGPLVRKIDRPKGRVRVRTVRHPFFSELANLFVVRGVKRLNRDALRELGPLGFGVWHLDDGSYSPDRVRKDGRIDKRTIRFATCSFSEEENLFLRNLLRERVGAESTRVTWRNPRDRERPYVGIRLHAENVDRFIAFVRPALGGCGMGHKLGEADDVGS